MQPVDFPPFQAFGFGPRPTYVYRHGRLFRWHDQKVIFETAVETETIDASAYRVDLQTPDGHDVAVEEDAAQIRLVVNGKIRVLAESESVQLPDFAGQPDARILRMLLGEVLVNLVDGCPLPNRFTYERPHYRDAAVIAMVLERTGNLSLIESWIKGLEDPFDYANLDREAEPDNLGQVLYMLSLIGEKRHPLVSSIRRYARQFEQLGEKGRRFLNGKTDGAPRPRFQTKWMKFGLQSIGLDDRYLLPEITDSYDHLCWWLDEPYLHPDQDFFQRDVWYPYLAWAEAHALRLEPPWHLLGDEETYRTWETRAPQADHTPLIEIGEALCRAQHAVPHAGHAAEAFLYLAELGSPTEEKNTDNGHSGSS